MEAVYGYVKNIWSGASVGARGAITGANWAIVVRYALVVGLAAAALSVYSTLNRYEYLHTREYSEGEYNVLRFDRLRGRLEECVVPGIDGTFTDPTRDQAICVSFRAKTSSADHSRD